MNLFQLFGEIAIRNEAANKAITDTTQRAGNASRSIKNAFEKIGSAAVACGKVIASGMAVGAAAMGALLKSSIGEYAEYEQLVGGIETLFKESKRKVMDYANEAYKTAGLSANEYMSTVTSFSASLLQGLGGDTEAAAEIANMAIVDMSDNANKMGTSMELIQNAYQGFAKQNYTMLDNLKLGYGGTQAEMARLINDSGVLGDAITITADTVNQVPFNKIIEAIHVVQTEMDITGTTAKEASTTISGSFASFKATWKNLLAGFGEEDADISTLFWNMVDAGEIVLQNVTAVLPTIKENIGVVLGELATYIDEEMQNSVWPVLQNIFGLPDWSTTKETLITFWNDVKEPLTNFADVLGVIAGFTYDALVDTLQWILNNGGTVAVLLEGIAVALVVGAIAAHPYLSALAAIVGYLEALKKYQEDIDTHGENLGIDMDRLKKEPIAYSIETQKNATKTPFETIGRLIEDTKATVEVGAELQEGAEANLQNELDGQSLSVDVKVNPIWSWFLGVNQKLGLYKGTSTMDGGDGSHADGLDKAPVKWNAEGAIFSKPTIFNTRLGLQGVGEAGTEAVAPIDKLQQYVADAVQSTVGGMQFNIVLDTGVLVGQLAPSMDMQLGSLASRKGRG